MKTKAVNPKVYLLRNSPVMLDIDLAALYEMDRNELQKLVRKHIKRFPFRNMFQLSESEWNLISLTNKNLPVLSVPPLAFSEAGFIYLSSLIKPVSLQTNIGVVISFLTLKGYKIDHQKLWHHVSSVMKKEKDHCRQVNLIFDAIEGLVRSGWLVDAEKEAALFFEPVFQ